MSLDDYGLLAGHCDNCGAPVDYCVCTPGECPGCSHCEDDER